MMTSQATELRSMRIERKHSPQIAQHNDHDRLGLKRITITASIEHIYEYNYTLHRTGPQQTRKIPS